MALKKPNAVLFDLDGTLVRHKNEKLMAKLERYDTLIHLLTKPFKAGILPRDLDLAAHVESNPLIHRLIHGIRIMRGIGVRDVVEPETDTIEILEYLNKRDIPVGLSSNAHGGLYGKYILRQYGLKKYFSAILFRENSKHGKPHPEPLLRAIHKLGLDETKPQVIWYIGDQAKDMKAAIKAKEKLPDNFVVVPLAFRATESSAYLYMSRLLEKDDRFSNQNFVRNFKHLMQKLEKL